MKVTVFVTALLLGSVGIACDSLVGKWSCTESDNRVSLLTVKAINGGVSMVSTDVEGTSPEMFMDGQPHTVAISDGVQMDYISRIQCSGPSALMTSNTVVTVNTPEGSFKSNFKSTGRFDVSQNNLELVMQNTATNEDGKEETVTKKTSCTRIN